MSDSTPQPSSLRAQQVAQTRGSLIRAGRELFGQKGFRETSVEDLARAARVTTGALYHHFPTKTALFEAVFEQAHSELMAASMEAAQGASDDLDELGRGFEAFLDAVLEPDLQRILILDGPAVLGPARYTELDERYAFAVIAAGLRAATESGSLRVEDPETVTRLLLGALTRGAMLIANSADPVGTRHAVAQSMRALMAGFVRPA
jgi:AcrR family transcriptional regulator